MSVPCAHAFVSWPCSSQCTVDYLAHLGDGSEEDKSQDPLYLKFQHDYRCRLQHIADTLFLAKEP
jgi:hypothetical protein